MAGDAERLPVGSGRFDGALVAFGIRNVGDPAAALRELRRVLRPGGPARRPRVLDAARAPSAPLYRLYSRHVLPRIGGWISGDRGAYAYLPASVARFATPAEFGALMEAAGFARVRWAPLTGGIAHALSREERP